MDEERMQLQALWPLDSLRSIHIRAIFFHGTIIDLCLELPPERGPILLPPCVPSRSATQPCSESTVQGWRSGPQASRIHISLFWVSPGLALEFTGSKAEIIYDSGTSIQALRNNGFGNHQRHSQTVTRHAFQETCYMPATCMLQACMHKYIGKPAVRDQGIKASNTAAGLICPKN